MDNSYVGNFTLGFKSINVLYLGCRVTSLRPSLHWRHPKSFIASAWQARDGFDSVKLTSKRGPLKTSFSRLHFPSKSIFQCQCILSTTKLEPQKSDDTWICIKMILVFNLRSFDRTLFVFEACRELCLLHMSNLDIYWRFKTSGHDLSCTYFSDYTKVQWRGVHRYWLPAFPWILPTARLSN